MKRHALFKSLLLTLATRGKHLIGWSDYTYVKPKIQYYYVLRQFSGAGGGIIESLMKTPLLTNRRLLTALACYAVLALIGALALEGILRAAVLCFFAILAVKTLIHSQKDDDMP